MSIAQVMEQQDGRRRRQIHPKMMLASDRGKSRLDVTIGEEKGERTVGTRWTDTRSRCLRATEYRIKRI